MDSLRLVFRGSILFCITLRVYDATFAGLSGGGRLMRSFSFPVPGRTAAKAGGPDEIPRTKSRHTVPIVWAAMPEIQAAWQICRRVRLHGVPLQGPALEAARTVGMRCRGAVEICSGNVAAVSSAGAVVDGGRQECPRAAIVGR